MRSFENTVIIQRPAEEIFAFLADFENIPKWNYAIDDTSQVSAGPVAVGTRYRQTRSVPSRGTEDFEVTVFEPARRLDGHGARTRNNKLTRQSPWGYGLCDDPP